jgi:hypothetical protein
MPAHIPEFGESVSEFANNIVIFFYIVIALICLGVIWGVWARLKGDLRTGGFSQVAFTILKLAVIVLIGYYLVQYGKDSGFFDEIYKTFHPVSGT